MDCSGVNIMMDASAMYPDGYHPQEPWRKRDLSGLANHYTRTQRPPKYYLIDFGLSTQYDTRDPPPMERVIRGADRSVPEFEITNDHGPLPCNPFPIDIYYVGNMIRTDFLNGTASENYKNRFRGFGFIKSLVDDMTAEDPARRPTIDDVIERFKSIRKRLSSWKLRSRLLRVSDSRLSIYSIAHWYLTIGYVLGRLPPIPSASLDH